MGRLYSDTSQVVEDELIKYLRKSASGLEVSILLEKALRESDYS